MGEVVDTNFAEQGYFRRIMDCLLSLLYFDHLQHRISCETANKAVNKLVD